MPRDGRPQRLTARIERDGKPVTIHDAIVNDVADGMPLDLAIRRSGCTTGTVTHWFQEAARVSERQLINPRHPMTPNEKRLIDFSRDVDHARAEAERKFVNLMDRLANGGVARKVIERTDENGRVTRTVEAIDVAPSFQAIRWRLESTYGRAVPLDVRIEEGRHLDDEERAAIALEALDAYLQGVADGQPAPAPNGTGNGHA